MDLPIAPLGPVLGELSLPGDKSISHRMAFLAAFAEGTSCLRNFPTSQDCRSTLRVLAQLGIAHEESEPGTVRIFGQGGRFTPSAEILDCGNSGTTARLLMGLLAGQQFEAIIDGDASLRKRSMKSVMTSLREMGAEVISLSDGGYLPIYIRGNRLRAKEFAPTAVSAQLKGAILLAGLQAEGRTSLEEELPTRDHTERALCLAGVKVAAHGEGISLEGGQRPQRFDMTLPGDISSGAFWLALAAPVDGARMILRNVSLNTCRLGFVDALIHMGPGVREDVIACDDGEEWYGHLDIRGRPLRPFHVGREMVPSLIDELPVLAVMAAKATGLSTIRGAGDLRGKETDRIAATVANLKLMGVAVEEFSDGMAIHGIGKLRGADMPSYGDHRIAMAFAIAGLLAEDASVIRDAECISVSYPEFQADLSLLAESTNWALASV